MTRFTRAKGSKASNERVPEEATSWQEMKRQMEDKKLEEKAKKQKAKFEREAAIYRQSSSDIDTTVKWASFQDVSSKKKKNKKASNECDSMSAKLEKSVINENQAISSERAYNSDDDAPVEVSAKITPTIVVAKPKKRKKEPLKIDVVVSQNKTDEAKKQKLDVTEEIAENFKTGQEKKKLRRRARKNKEAQQGKAQSNENNANSSWKLGNQKRQDVNEHYKGSKRKLPKVKDDKEHKRRKPLLEDTSIVLNGKTIELQYFGGFLIKKEDANRLFKLRNEMRKKGVPKSEMEITLKLERRKAEKALAREKKKLCFHCRQSGHELSECPNLTDGTNVQNVGTGICFKCGSTEHTHFECKVVRNENYKFATCFICKEEGHISRQCPDNPKGIYPRGGACRVCQDVTHLKKDCPVFQQQQESVNATLDTIGSENVEGIEGGDTKSDARKKIKSKKVVKFNA